MTGGGVEAEALADVMSQSWINFARHGNPEHDSLPSWKPYSNEKGSTMFFDNKCKVQYHHDKKILEIMGLGM